MWPINNWVFGVDWVDWVREALFGIEKTYCWRICASRGIFEWHVLMLRSFRWNLGKSYKIHGNLLLARSFVWNIFDQVRSSPAKPHSFATHTPYHQGCSFLQNCCRLDVVLESLWSCHLDTWASFGNYQVAVLLVAQVLNMTVLSPST